MNIHTIIQGLQEIYNTHAHHFSQTRKKYRAEIEKVCSIIEQIPHQKIILRDLGCGDGTLYTYLQNKTSKHITYYGVDIAEKLLSIGRKKHPQAKRYVQDMIQATSQAHQESIDVVVCLASMHHIPTYRQRIMLLKNIYRMLRYEGLLVMTNWCISKRFIKKYRTTMLVSSLKMLISLGKRSRKDVYMPRNRSGKRYYHLFFKGELKKILEQTGFVVDTNEYINKKGEIVANRKNAANIYTIARKSVKQKKIFMQPYHA